MNDKSQDGASLVVVGLGEALFDCFGDRHLLGGAPVNFTVHVHRLLAGSSGRGVLMSRVGADPLGEELTAEVGRRGIATHFVQVDAQRPTGRVNVQVSPSGNPTYEIAEDVAWDFIAYDPSCQSLAASCSAVCFGTLAQRSATSRETIARFLNDAANAVRLYDVNLRQNFYDRDVLEASFQAATIVKLNHEELFVVARLLFKEEGSSEDADRCVERLIAEYGLSLLALTRGSEGTVLYRSSERVEGEPVSISRRPDSDSVGAGDACCAGILYGTLLEWPLERTVELANRMGAYVASQPGATPELPAELLELAGGPSS